MKIAVVCSHGGHLTEMMYLMGAFEGQDVFFVTYDNPRTRSLSSRHYLFPNFGEKPSELLKSLPLIAGILLKEKPDILISNGAEIAIPFFYLSKLLGIKTVFIECYTRVNDPTVTGKSIYPVADLFLVLWPEMLMRYGKKARYHGPLLVSRTDHTASAGDRGDRILVVVGMHSKSFERLIVKMDDIAGKARYDVVMQIGHTNYEPHNAQFFKFKARDEDMRSLMESARIVVCQGAMTVVDAINAGASVIVVPRLMRFAEHVNDHQLFFARKLEEQGLVRVIDDINHLEDEIKLLEESSSQTPNSLVVNRELVNKIREYIREIAPERRESS
jgi:UDP-N-acetylglucosamine transferase subunit ALG13